MRTIDRKLVRDLWAIKGQSLAIILVQAAGISLLVMSLGMIASLSQTMEAYYDRYRFGDVFASATRAPILTLLEIRAIDGVAAAEGRVVGGGLVDIPTIDAPVSASFVSLGEDPRSELNGVHIVQGRRPNPVRTDEVLVLNAFAEAVGLELGDTVSVVAYGKKRQFRMVGTALSPEFIYAIAPGAPTVDDDRFTIIWAPKEALEAAFDMDGAFNDLVVRLDRGAGEAEVTARIDRVLSPFGGRDAFGRNDQISNKFLTEELKQLRVMTFLMTPIFMGVTIFLLNVVIGRLVQTEREQIGLLKAFGYTDGEVGLHYAKFALILAFLGALVGWGGGLYLGRVITRVYQSYYSFPFLIFETDFRTAAYAFGLSLLGAGVGAFGAVRSAIGLQPAVAMRPPAPERFAKAGGIFGAVSKRLDGLTRMVLRQMTRRPVRAGTLILGIGAAMGLSVMMEFNRAAIGQILDVSFHVVDRSDLTVRFREPLHERVTLELGRLGGVRHVEAFRSVAVSFRHGTEEYLGGITGVDGQPRLNRIVDESLRDVVVPEEGLLISSSLSRLLGAEVGDVMTVEVREGRQPSLEIEIVGIMDAMIGTPAYMSRSAINRLLLEPGRVSGAYLASDSSALAALQRQMKEIPQLSNVSARSDVLTNFEELLEEGPGTFRTIMTLFAGLIAVGVVYNGARITFGERRYDLASLRVLGFTRAEASYVVTGEIMILVILALPVGALIGTLIWSYISVAMSNELYQVPTVWNPAGFGAAAIIVLLSGAVSVLMIRRDIGRLDMVSALKARD
ncbi:FtsX-like permease family protein [Parvularcula sp. ZS-1/3]|uniref:FtsX-like permease family protein n=1 Tax=Parvularcula mediterranea TaxID=2732508 RepID=A0A7Y3RNW9_9PROT|nr:FtsX-like permease family protein [Parvularcula mediterranea]NNU17554.1 FtsX-like permease family protein [Parvularcula mediterranea]